MELSSCKLGSFNLYTIETGRFGLDGGAMFGVVPKPLWQKAIVPDEQNRIPLAMRCLLVESTRTGKRYLIDTGIGRKFSRKFEDIYKIDHEHSDLVRSLNFHGFSSPDITDIILTHLHFDHCGGASYRRDGQESGLTFPEARHWITESQWETALQPNAREKASFLDENIDPLRQQSKLELIPSSYTFEEGLSTIIVNGHTIGQQLVKIEANGIAILFAADLVPTAAHVSLPWVMGYDMHPVQTLDEKRDILSEWCQSGHYLYLEHDAFNEAVTLEQRGGRFSIGESTVLTAFNRHK
ncbi:MAG TPA: MBL fold metallo-hydrolase [Balneolales bacterium]|nr:MBL fold metallo-hydrolase [Balneolales bacterium]